MSYPLKEESAPQGTPSPLANDILWGVNEIAAEIGQSTRQTYHQLETGKLPAGKQSGKWISSRSRLRAHFDQVMGRGV
jgi:hypothetical protein